MNNQPQMTFDERLAAIRRGRDECWIWTWATTKGGYGHFCKWVDGVKRYFYAHRTSYERTFGPIAPKHHIDHSCGTKLCCNPLHLKPRTPKEHRQRHARDMTKCVRGHDLTAPNAFRYPDRAQRVCRLCREGWDAVRWKPAEAAAYRMTKRRKPPESRSCDVENVPLTPGLVDI